MSSRPRAVCAEILDGLEAGDPRAVRSRRDLQRLNRVMGSEGILLRLLGPVVDRKPVTWPVRVLELGAGDGSLMLRLARRLAEPWPGVDLTLLDRQGLVDEATGAAFARFGWQARTAIVDVLEWARTPLSPQLPPRWHLILTNLFLHHFDDGPLRELLSAVAVRCDAFIACEPRRGAIALAGSHMLGVLGVNDVTRNDGVLSVRAGFRKAELSRLWPNHLGRWQLEERAAGFFSHAFRAVRASSN